HHGHRALEHRLLDRDGAVAQAAEAAGGDADAARDLSAVAHAGATRIPRARSDRAAAVRLLRVWRACAGIDSGRRVPVPARFLVVLGAWPADFEPRADD